MSFSSSWTTSYCTTYEAVKLMKDAKPDQVAPIFRKCNRFTVIAIPVEFFLRSTNGGVSEEIMPGQINFVVGASCKRACTSGSRQ